MTTVALTVNRIQTFPALRSALPALAACAYMRDQEHMAFDADSPCFSVLQARYPELRALVAEPIADALPYGREVDAPRRPESGCGRCRGRRIAR